MDKKEVNIKKSEFHKKYIRTPEFQEVRNAVFERDGHKCVLCGRTENLVCHHTSYKHLGQHNQAEIDDCITICQLDHINHHRGKYNINWYSVDHPRNNDDLREVEFNGCHILVRSNGLDFYDAETFKKYKISSCKDSKRNLISINRHTSYCNRVVAKAFPEICGEWFDDCEVHHIDEDCTNDRAENLVVMTKEEHNALRHEKSINRRAYKNSIPVYQYTLSGNYVAKYVNATKAGNAMGIVRSGIRNAVSDNNVTLTSCGYIWKTFKEGEEIPLWIEPILSGKERTKLKNQIPISQYTLDGKWIRDWTGLDEPTKYYGGKSHSAINNMLRGRTKSAYGYVWKYKS